MAILHRAELRPSKLELLTTWLAHQPWAYSSNDGWERVAAFRFDDPAGEVGVETIIVKAGDGPELQVPLSYRGAPLEGAEEWLVGTMEHSVLGSRWVYDACADPVYAHTLASTIVNGGREAEQFLEVDGRREPVDGGARVKGSGNSAIELPPFDLVGCSTSDGVTRITTSAFELFVSRRVDARLPSEMRGTLSGTWGEETRPVLLAGLVHPLEAVSQ